MILTQIEWPFMAADLDIAGNFPIAVSSHAAFNRASGSRRSARRSAER